MKKKCLIIIPGIPYPPIDGHKLKIFNLIKILHHQFDLHIVTIDKKSLKETEKTFIDQYSYKSHHFQISVIASLPKMFFNLFTKRPFQVCYYTVSEIKKYLGTQTLQDEYVLINLIRSAEYIKLLRNKNIIFDMVDLLSKSYDKSSKTTNSVLFKMIYTIESKRLSCYEPKIINQSDLTLCVNKAEAEDVSRYGNVKWIPNGVNESIFEYNKRDGNYQYSIAFFGAMFYQPNIDAVLWFDKYVLDWVDSKIRFYIIGSKPSKEVCELAKKRSNVIITGFMEDPYLILNSCDVILAPMQNGGGIQNKILETMALGKVNILTTYAAEPIIGGIAGQHFLVEDNPEKMAELVNDVCFSFDKYAMIGKTAKQLILEQYTWTNYKDKLYNAITDLK